MLSPEFLTGISESCQLQPECGVRPFGSDTDILVSPVILPLLPRQLIKILPLRALQGNRVKIRKSLYIKVLPF